MVEIMYNPTRVGDSFMNQQHKTVVIRKYHFTPKEGKLLKQKFDEITTNVPKRIKNKAGEHFFNPYRKGVYYSQIQALYLLGCNEWHSLTDVKNQMRDFMRGIDCTISDGHGHKSHINAWDKFRRKTPRADAKRSKDETGRIMENMLFFQRLTMLHPYGYKLRQVRASLDIRRVTSDTHPNGKFYYRLSTHKTVRTAYPMRDYSEFEFPLHERKFVSGKFIGKVVMKDKTIVKGVEV